MPPSSRDKAARAGISLFPAFFYFARQKMAITITKAVAKARRDIDTVLPRVPRGKFLEIERIDCVTGKSLSLVAYRNHGDLEGFRKQIERMFTDACDALEVGQEIKINIAE